MGLLSRLFGTVERGSSAQPRLELEHLVARFSVFPFCRDFKGVPGIPYRRYRISDRLGVRRFRFRFSSQSFADAADATNDCRYAMPASELWAGGSEVRGQRVPLQVYLTGYPLQEPRSCLDVSGV